MSHLPHCTKSREGREEISDIIRYAVGENERLTFIAEALRNREATYFCPDNNCRVEMVPRSSSDRIPQRTKGGDKFTSRRAHFTSLPDRFVQGPKRETKSQRQLAIELIASQMRSSALYEQNDTGENKVYTGGNIDIEINRSKDTKNHRAGWDHFATCEVDIIATRKWGEILIQIEEDRIGKRYENFAHFLTRVRRLADNGKDKRKVLRLDNGDTQELSGKIYQTTVVINNGQFLQPETEGTCLTPTGTMLNRLFDNVYVLDLEQGKLFTLGEVKYEKDPNTGLLIPFTETENPLTDFGFVERTYNHGKQDWKRYEEIVIRSSSRVLIPQLRVAKAIPAAYDCDKHSVNLDPHGQGILSGIK